MKGKVATVQFADLHRRVWEEMLLAEMRADYFGELVRHYLNWEKGIRISVLLASSGAAATVLSGADPIIKLLFPLAATTASLFLVFSQFGVMSREAADLHSQWCALEADYERLWNRLSEDSEAEKHLEEIYLRGDALSKTGTKFPIKAKRLEHWLDHATELKTARYA